MSQSDDLPPPRRPLFFPVVIATVLLSIIGMSAGLVLGSRHEEQRTGGQTNYVPDPQSVSPVRCPDQMHATAARVGFELPMTQVLKVRTTDTGTTVWICENSAGELFYQANKGGAEDRWVEGETALFLSDVTRKGDGFLAKAVDGNTFFVNNERLEVVKKGKARTFPVEPQ